MLRVLATFCLFFFSAFLDGQDAFTISTVFSSSSATSSGTGPTTPTGVAVDAAGNVFVSDPPTNRVFRKSTTGVLTVVAGTGTAGFSGDSGLAVEAQLNQPTGIGLDGAGNLFIVDDGNHRIRRVSTDGIITTVAGNPNGTGLADGQTQATDLRLGFMINAVAVDPTGAFYFPDLQDDTVVYVNTAGIASTALGPGVNGNALFPMTVALDPGANLLTATPNGIYRWATLYSSFTSAYYYMAASTGRGVCYTDAYRIKCVASQGQQATVIAGTGQPGFGGDGGPATAASINNPTGMTFDSAGNLYFADTANARVRKITPGGIISTVIQGVVQVQVRLPKHVSADASGNLYISDETAHVVWRKPPGGAPVIFAGTGVGGFGADGVLATDSSLYAPEGLAADSQGNVYIAESGSHRVRVVGANGIIKTIAGTGSAGFSGDGGPGAAAMLNTPMDVAVDPLGNVFIADSYNNRIRQVSPGGTITTVAGSGPMLGFGSAYANGDGDPAISAQLNNPSWVAAGPTGDVFVSDSNFVRKFHPGGVISVVAGTGACAPLGDGGPATNASFCTPSGLAVDTDGSLYVSDQGNERIRRIDPNGVVSTVAGTGVAGFSGDGGAAIDAQINVPWGIALDGAGNLYVADLLNTRIREVTGSGRCTPALSQTSLVTDSGATSGSLSLEAPENCAYTITTDSGPVHLNSSSEGSGNTSILYSLDANSQGSVSGTLMISTAGSRVGFTVYQSGANCQFSLPPSPLSVPYTGQTTLVQLTQNPSLCLAYQVTSSAQWLQIIGASSWSGAPSIPYRILNNSTAASRSAVLAVNNQTLTVIQDPAPVTLLSPADGTMFPDCFVTFKWTLGAASQFEYEVSTSKGAADIASGFTGTGSVSVPILPGGPIYFRLWSKIGGIWNSVPLQAAYTAPDSCSLQAVSDSPAAGSGSSKTMSFTFFNAKGWQHLGVVNVLINNFLDGRQACYIAYVPQSNTLYLVDDGGDAAGPYAGSLILNGSGSVSNSQCGISGAGSTVTVSGGKLTLTLKLSFSTAFTGNHIVYLAARDDTDASSGWRALGTWNVPSAVTPSPFPLSMAPASGTISSQTLTFVFYDAKTAQDLGIVNILLNNFLDGRGACYLAYSQPNQLLYLVNDAGDALSPGFSLNGSGTLANSQCTIHGAGSSVTASGNLLTITLNVTFSSTFAGAKVFYLAARDVSGNNSGWQAEGSWDVP